MKRLFSTAVAALFAATASAAVNMTGITLPAITELDLVFPRNNTVYAPSSFFPVVFALQNTRLAAALNPALDVEFTVGGNDTYGGSVGINLRYANYTNGSDPLFLYASTSNFENMTAATSITLEWTFSAPNCTLASSGAAGAGGVLVHKSISFSVAGGAQAPDLVNATANDGGCASITRAVYNISAVEDMSLGDNYINYDSGSCARYTDLSMTPTAGNPCAVHVDTAAAASMSAAMVAKACFSQIGAPLGCPKSSAGGVSTAGGRGAALVAVAAVCTLFL